jgi:hypothetical protein
MAAATNLSLTLGVTGQGKLSSSLDLSTPGDSVQIGAGNFDAISVAFDFGTASAQAKEWFHDERSILTGANDDLDLAGGLTNPFGTAITFTVVKWLIIDIDAPDGTKVLRVGPQGVANAWQGPHGGVAAGNYITVHRSLFHVEPYTGWTVTAGTGDILRINNPGAGTVNYRIWLGGEV